MARILVVEDDPELQVLVAAQLEGGGHTSAVFSTGREALQKVSELAPELALIDLNLPQMNGFEVLRALRSTQASARAPCIIMTALADPGRILETAAEGLGAVDFLQKPFLQEDLLEAVADALAEFGPCAPPCGELERGPLKLEGRFRRVWVKGRALGILPKRRFQLLWLLASRQGPAPKDQLVRDLWQGGGDANRLEKTVQRLREDLGREGPRLILTLPGGYEFKS